MRLIDADELVTTILTNDLCGDDNVDKAILNAPTIDAIPIKWIEVFSKQQDKKQYKDFLEFMLNYWSMHGMHALELWRKENE